jgi:hypothetical protein
MEPLEPPETRFGIAGAGRLGGALAASLAEAGHEVLLYDREETAARVTAGGRLHAVSPGRLLREADPILLCLPAPEVAPFLRRHRSLAPPAAPVLNLATAASTRELRRSGAAEGWRLVAFKVVGQYRAVRLGLPVLFVTEPQPEEDLARLRAWFAPLGEVAVGDEEVVAALNRAATRAALELCLELRRRAAGFPLGHPLLAAAMRHVAAGTLVEFPPQPADGYAHELLREIQEGKACPRNQVRRECGAAAATREPALETQGGART